MLWGAALGNRVVPEIADEVRAIWEVLDHRSELHVRNLRRHVRWVVGIATNVKGMLTSLIILAIPYDTEILKHPVLPVYLEVFDV